jgi:hypothetical protein
MFGAATPYLVGFGSALFAALSFVVLITAVRHFDQPEQRGRK